jgi:hypothetical protein
MGKVRAFWGELVDQLDGSFEVEVAGVRFAAESVEDEDVQALEER